MTVRQMHIFLAPSWHQKNPDESSRGLAADGAKLAMWLLAPKKPGRVVKGGIDSESDNEKNLVSQGFRVAAGGFEPTTFGLSLSRMMIIVVMISQLFPFFWRLSEKGSKAHGR
jgi:hypothetical protein